MKRILLAGATFLAFTAAQPAVAQPIPVFNWTGMYVGVSGGGAWGTSDWTFTTLPLTTIRGSGWLLGGTLGANWQTGMFVFGAEGDFSWANLNMLTTGSTALFAGQCASGPGPGCSADMKWFGTIRGRVGVVSGTVLFYLTGGFAAANFSYAIPLQPTGTVTATGWTVGGGLEAMVTPNWTVKGEYLYADLRDSSACGPAICAPPGVIAHNTVHIVRLGLNFKFGG
jgi:outer membrane immunogenic protein